jgi:DNA-binding NtrC family response regulator
MRHDRSTFLRIGLAEGECLRWRIAARPGQGRGCWRARSRAQDCCAQGEAPDSRIRRTPEPARARRADDDGGIVLMAPISHAIAREAGGRAPSEPTLLGTSPAMEWLRSAATRVAAGNAKVLITGESGVGKDLLARFIHVRSERAARPFVAINCAGVSETLLESELFGHVRGSFTGAHRDKVGLFHLGHRGTVFLDEVGEMSLRMQAMLLRFLENGEVKPVGSDVVAATVDVRVIAATNRSLPDMVTRGQFREDLMYRIMVVHIAVPPLRERREDIRALVAHTIARLGPGLVISDEAMDVIERYRWPGNVRELQNVIEQLVWLCAEKVVEVKDLPPALVASANGAVTPAHDRRRCVADYIYDAFQTGSCSFWEHVYPMFINRDITRADLTGLVRRGLAVTGGNYRAALPALGMQPSDYKRFLNLLSTHGCTVDFREFRSGRPTRERPIEPPFRSPMLKSTLPAGSDRRRSRNRPA